MERLDFASVMKVIHDHIREGLRSNQTQLLETLFWDMLCDSDANKSFDEGQVCKWMSGLAKLSPKVSKYYQEHSNQRKLAVTIEERILPMMPDSSMAVQELYDLLIQAPNVSQSMKANLTEGFPFEDQNEEAVFMTDVLCLAMQVKYEKRDIRSKSLLVAGSLSPAVQGYIYDSDIPKPCRWFVGREKELEQLHGLLVDHSKVFVHGIPGIGKSELAKAYVSRHNKEYTNVLYLYYGGDLKRMIADMDFADDRPGESQEVRFQRHDRFLRTLRDDTLLVVDNYNVTSSEDSFLDVLLRYRCRILFTTRCRYEDQATLEIQELHPDTLVELMGKFYDVERKLDVMKEIIILLHGHTFAVELAARLLANSMLRPKALLKKLKKEKAAMDAEDRIRSVKDGISRKATYYDHIHAKFLSALKHIRVKGIHVFAASGVLDYESLVKVDQYIFELIQRTEEYTEKLDVIDFGGGLGIDYTNNNQEFDVARYGQELRQMISFYGLQDKEIIMELGTYLVGNAGYYTAKIIDIKEIKGKKHIIIAGGVNHMGLPLEMQRKHPVHIIPMNEPKLYSGQPGVHGEIADISGPLCMVSDKLSWDDYIENAEIGDIVVYRQAGAYCFGEGMHQFLMHPLPEEKIVDEGVMCDE